MTMKAYDTHTDLFKRLFKETMDSVVSFVSGFLGTLASNFALTIT